MKPNQLIGQRAIRTKEIRYINGVADKSYTDSPILILHVTPHHIVANNDSGRRIVLNHDWIDENWTSYDELMRAADVEEVIAQSRMNAM